MHYTSCLLFFKSLFPLILFYFLLDLIFPSIHFPQMFQHEKKWPCFRLILLPPYFWTFFKIFNFFLFKIWGGLGPVDLRQADPTDERTKAGPARSPTSLARCQHYWLPVFKYIDENSKTQFQLDFAWKKQIQLDFWRFKSWTIRSSQRDYLYINIC